MSLSTTARLGLFAVATLMLTACPPKEPDEDSEEEDTSDNGGGGGGGGGGGSDTGIMQQYYYAFVQTADGVTMDAGGLGFIYEGKYPGDEGELCRVAVEWLDSGEAAPAGCPFCDWSFDPAPGTSAPAEGAYCEQFGLANNEMAAYADGWVLPIGFATDYPYYYEADDGSTGELTIPEVVFLYTETSGWFMFAYNYGYTTTIYGDSSDMEVKREAWDKYGEYVYYMYYRY